MTFPSAPGWSVEPMHDSMAQALREDRVLFDSQTPHQRLRVFENARFGRVLTLDGVVQLTEQDECIYHEMMVHVPVLAHGDVRRVLIIGGGDGGTAREVLRHAMVTDLTMVEIDPDVIEFSKTYLPTLSDGAFEDPRLELIIDDGVAFMAQEGPAYDLILVDSTDPGGPSEPLFTPEFYQSAKGRLAPGGILITQYAVPFMMPDELRQPMGYLAEIFEVRGCYLAHVPSFSGGPMAFGWASDDPAAMEAPVEVLSRRLDAAGLAPRHYSPELHHAAFALPRYVTDLLG